MVERRKRNAVNRERRKRTDACNREMVENGPNQASQERRERRIQALRSETRSRK